MPCPRFVAVVAALALSVAWTPTTGSSAQPQKEPVISVHNRLLLNRLAVNGHRDVEVMVALKPGRFHEGLALVARLGGLVQRSEPEIDYIRVLAAINRVVELVTNAGVEAYQIASLANGSWYVDGRPRSRADSVRRAEVQPVVGARSVERRPDLPALSAQEARSSGYTADLDSGVRRWLSEHPTFDGRGVTIAFLESALLEYGHPALQTAKTLDGVNVPKIAGILNMLGPDDADETRVDLAVDIHATRSWHRVANRTYILPRAGHYRFGVFSLPVAVELEQRFAVIRDEDTHEIYVDTNSDASFRDERPIADANVHMDVGHLRVSHPRAANLGFVLTSGRQPNQVHLYGARSGHQTMTVSVATGNATDEGLTVGVAPGARALIVRYLTRYAQFHTILEGYLDTIRLPEVDILCDSTGLVTTPDTAGDFAATFFRRLIARYRKPIFHAAGNAPHFLASVSSVGDVFTVGGAIGPATFSSLYGGGSLRELMVHPMSAAGPAIDGTLKPDFLAPANRISGGLWIEDGYVPVPKNAPRRHLPAGYEISCCTSASSPYAAGLAALLLSAAKQHGVPYSVEVLGRALRAGAQFLPAFPAHQQGTGVLDVNAAWRELRRPVALPRITVRADNAHALRPYAGGGQEGIGLFEQFGWKPGDQGIRTFQITRETGGPAPTTYRLSWTGNDGTFSAPTTVTLPLNVSVALPVAVSARLPGAHSALLNVHDPDTDAVVFHTQATVVVTAPTVDAKDGRTRLSGSIPLMHGNEHFLNMPDGVNAMSIELDVQAGALTATVLPANGLYRSYDDHVLPGFGRTFTKGRYHLMWPRPEPGTWTIHLSNISAWLEGDASLVSSDTAVYTVTVQPMSASMDVRRVAAGGLEVDISNHLGTLREPVLEVSSGTRRTHDAALLPTGLPNLFEINVPDGASTLRLDLRGAAPEGPTLELYLYDCTSGECFSWDFTLPARHRQTIAVRDPAPGRWVAAVNTAPSATKTGHFTLDEIVTTSATRRPPASAAPQATGAKWTELVAGDADGITVGTEASQIVMCELIDAAAERDATSPWDTRQGVSSLAHRSIAIGTAIWSVR